MHAELFRQLQIKVVAASADHREQALATVQQLWLSFPVGCDIDTKAVANLIGAYYDDSKTPPYLQATGFLLSPDGKIIVAVYSSRSIGRLTAPEVASLVEIIRRRSQ